MLSLLLLVLAVICVAVNGANPLGPYKVTDVTVSGLSSGGYMAVQVHMAYSSVVNGSAIFAGGPFYCAQNNIMYAEMKCMKVVQGLPDVSSLVSYTQSQAKSGLIDSVSNLADDSIFLFSGTEDSIVNPAVMKSLQSYYGNFVSQSQIVTDFTLKAEHCFPTEDFGEACAKLGSPYIGKCSYDGAGKAFQTLYGQSLQAKTAQVAANFMSFSQAPYFPTTTGHSLGDTGYIYVPTACAQGSACRLHVSFHGCEQTERDTGTDYPEHVGLNEWAESNNVIVLYPYAKRSQTNPSNPNGCWDWWGYTDKNYVNNKGVQMQFVRSLITAVTGQ